ncbi:MAG: helix-turn-helix domain-containing protein [Kiritimatiellia bacterium]|jgi:predicted transcriptional regulator|nr:helix-turn-helix domain-containing protein [Kiritimatiellia bacterium]
MTTSAMTFRNELKERLIDFVWQQWCRLGVSGASRRGNDRVIDPEVLLAFTSEIGRYDARLFDEVLDWLATNGSWINTQRVSAIMKQDKTGCPQVMGAMAAWMCDRDKSMKWRGIAKRYHAESQSPSEFLFRNAPDGTMSVVEEPDAHFARYGLMRETVQTRDMTQLVNMSDPANVIFRSRALFGINIRADVLVYLLTTEGGHARRIAELLGFNHMRVQSVLSALANAGFVTVRTEGKAKNYWIDRERWGPVMFPDQAISPRWVNWRPFVRGLTSVWREAWNLDDARADEYIVSSKMRVAMRKARDDLYASGIAFDIADDRNYVAEAYLPIFERDIAGILEAMTQ